MASSSEQTFALLLALWRAGTSPVYLTLAIPLRRVERNLKLGEVLQVHVAVMVQIVAAALIG
jgi:hypothetical protein